MKYKERIPLLYKNTKLKMEVLKPILQKLELKYQPQPQLLSFDNFLTQG